MKVEKGELSGERIDRMRDICETVIHTLTVKNPKYGESWRQYGGYSAFMNLARKWSRLETMAAANDYDIFKAHENTKDIVDNMEETLKDLIGYALLIMEDRLGQDIRKD